MRCLPIIIFLVLHIPLLAQRTSISYELNGRDTNKEIQDSIQISNNPFARFIGEWTLKDDTWIQNWGGDTDTILIPKHHTTSSQINTEASLLSIIDGPEPNGHIFWSFNPNTGQVSHLSSFGTNRIGVGQGEFYDQSNLRLKISFEGETPSTYRVYTYEWVSEVEYALRSVQFNENDQPTGLFYSGNFVRIHTNEQIQHEIESILNVLDDHEITKEKQIEVYAEDVVHMAPNNAIIYGKEDLLEYLKEQERYGDTDMKHEIIAYDQHGDMIVMQGRVTGVFHPADGGDGLPFQTKNLFIFKRIAGELKIAQVIYNMSPNE